MTDEQKSAASVRRHGLRVKGELVSVYVRVGAERYNELQRIRAERGWSMVTAIERAIDALAAQERTK